MLQNGLGGYDSRLARWDGTNLDMLGGVIEGLRMDALAVQGQQVYLAGRWSTNFDNAAIFRWDGAAWHPLVELSQTNGFIAAMATLNGHLYIGGVFDSIAGVRMNNLAQWDGVTWRSLGTGIRNAPYFGPSVYSLVTSGGKLCVGGRFSTAGAQQSGNFAIWTEQP
jgi:trimeric autotransporter adhesin